MITFISFHNFQEDCICVPHSATVYAQVIQSDLIWEWHKLQPIKIPGHSSIHPPAKMDACSGAASVHDIQLSQVSPEQFQPITSPLAMMDFNFSRGDFRESGLATVDADVLMEGICHGIFMWWDLSMDTKGEIRLSTAPSWAHPDGEEAQWRDHWMQAVYFFDQPLQVQKGGFKDICKCQYGKQSHEIIYNRLLNNCLLAEMIRAGPSSKVGEASLL